MNCSPDWNCTLTKSFLNLWKKVWVYRLWVEIISSESSKIEMKLPKSLSKISPNFEKIWVKLDESVNTDLKIYSWFSKCEMHVNWLLVETFRKMVQIIRIVFRFKTIMVYFSLPVWMQRLHENREFDIGIKHTPLIGTIRFIFSSELITVSQYSFQAQENWKIKRRNWPLRTAEHEF